MSNAWETTKDDVAIVVRERMGKSAANLAAIDHVFENLDFAAVEKAALCGLDIDTQTKFAYREIERQIRENGL